MYGGLDSGVSQWQSGQFGQLVTDMRADGHSVVGMSLPLAQACFFSLEGSWYYREAFRTSVVAIKAAVDAQHGAASVNVVGGISYGGLHSMTAAVVTGVFNAWWAAVPVTRVDALNPEFPGVGDARWFNTQFEAAALKNSDGWVSWGTSDTRVNGLLTKELALRYSSSVTKVENVGGVHELTAQNALDLRTWISALR